MQAFEFCKYQGLGNDFVIVDLRDYKPEEYIWLQKKDIISAICNRNFGVGADGIVACLNPERGGDIRMRIFNSNGTEAEMCGNGIRCLVSYINDNDRIKQVSNINVETKSGIILAYNSKDDIVTVNMGNPYLNHEDIPTTIDEGINRLPTASITIDEHLFNFAAVGMGNPHMVIPVKDLNTVKLKEWGPILENNTYFPASTNVHFVRVINQEEIEMLVWERGSGQTLACGTGACATLVACYLLGITKNKARVNLPGGILNIEWPDSDGPVYMSGPATKVYDGKIDFSNFNV